jgi:predicted porin
MNKKLLAVAVAAALAAPVAAFAQSTVTISGYIKLGLDNISYSGSPSTAAATRLNTNQVRMSDGSSQIILGMREDLGNGLAGVAQWDIRGDVSAGGAMATSGNSFVGLDSTTMGRLTMGRFDLHYAKAPAQVTNKAGALQGAATSLFDFIQGIPIANATRTPNVVRYDTVNFSGFSAVIAYSTNPLGNTAVDTQAAGYTNSSGTEADTLITTAAKVSAAGANRKGQGWNINPKYSNGPINVEYSYWNARPDAPVGSGLALSTAAGGQSLDQRGDALAGSYQFGGLNVGLAWNRSRLSLAVPSTTVSGGTKLAERTTWSLPVTYAWGPHTIAAHYTRAGSMSSNVAGVTTTDSGANMFAAAYVYDLSKRTSVALTYARINNQTNASYNLFTSNALGSTGDSIVANGESPRLLSAGIKHAF